MLWLSVFVWKRKAYLKNELERLDIRRGVGIDSFLDSKYSSIWKEYEQVLAKEEVHWYTKSKAKWLHLGDRNPKSFHGVTIIRRRRNRYDMIKDGDGNWVVDSEKLEEMATKFYKDLYTKDFIYLPLVTSHAFPKLRDEAREELRRIPSLREIY